MKSVGVSQHIVQDVPMVVEDPLRFARGTRSVKDVGQAIRTNGDPWRIGGKSLVEIVEVNHLQLLPN